MTGQIKCVRPDGYGFIEPDGGGPDLFVHASQVVPRGSFCRLRVGQRVTFEVMVSDSLRTEAIGVVATS